jgi:hypothetical protein
MVDVPWPISTNPGKKPQEGTGRLINAFAEPRGGDKSPVWRRAPGATVFARVPSSGSASMSFDANARGAVMFSTFFELVGTSTTVMVGGATGTLGYPPGSASGDVVFFVSGYSNTTGASAWTTPAGFTLITTGTTTDTLGHAIFYKACTGEQGVSYTNPGASQLVSLGFTLRGVNTTAPIADTTTAGASTIGMPDPPDVTATTADSLCVVAGWLKDNILTATTPPTTFCSPLFTNTGAGDFGIVVAFQPRPSSGAVVSSSFQGTRFDSTVVNTTVASGIWKSQAFTVRHD